MRMNLAQPVRKIGSHSAYMTRSSHYTVIGALVGTMTGFGLILNKQKVLIIITISINLSSFLELLCICY